MAKTKKPAESGPGGESKPRRAAAPRAPRQRNTPNASSASVSASPAAPAAATALPGTPPRVGLPAAAPKIELPAARPKAELPAAAPRVRTSSPTAEDIARRAYEIFCERGGTHGYHLDDWLQAERELRQRVRVV